MTRTDVYRHCTFAECRRLATLRAAYLAGLVDEFDERQLETGRVCHLAAVTLIGPPNTSIEWMTRRG